MTTADRLTAIETRLAALEALHQPGDPEIRRRKSKQLIQELAESLRAVDSEFAARRLQKQMLPAPAALHAAPAALQPADIYP